MAKHIVLALIHEENGIFGISFPDYPGCVSGGASMDEAVSKGHQALGFHLQGMVDDGDEVPEPSKISVAYQKASEEIAAGATPMALEVDFPGRAVRINISIEEGLLKQIDRAARTAGKNRSAFLSDAARSVMS